jgi:hypothetical protein
MLKVSVGHSNDPDSAEAIAEVLEQCQAELAGLRPKAGILFAAIDFEYEQLLAAIQATFPGLALIGTTTNAELSSVLDFQEDSVSLMLFAGDSIDIGIGLGKDLHQNPELAVQEALDMATANLSTAPKLCITFPESSQVDGDQVVRALSQQLGMAIPICGGTAADNLTFDRTHQFFNNRVYSNTVPILLIGGSSIQISCGVASGWQPIGQKTTVTKADGVSVYEIGGQRAIEFYRQQLGATDTFSEYVNYPLVIFPENAEEFYIRSPLTYMEANDSLLFTTSIPEGTVVQMAEAQRENVLQATATSLEKALAQYEGTNPQAALLISCAARRIVLGTQAKKEFQIFREKLPKMIPCCGFYAYGEISPFVRSEQSYFHNETFVTLLIGEN